MANDMAVTEVMPGLCSMLFMVVPETSRDLHGYLQSGLCDSGLDWKVDGEFGFRKSSRSLSGE